MSKIVNAQGTYNIKDTGEQQTYDFDYREFADLEEAVAELGKANVLKNVQRMEKVDANNTSREKAKVANGHSSRPVLTEAQKAENKAKRAKDKQILDAIKNNPELIAELLGK